MSKIELKNDESQIKTILDFYILTNKLKDLLRKGWQDWGIDRQRSESVAEHIFGTCMLAVAIWSETLPEVNLSEVILMLALHETEEIIISDITPFDDQTMQKLKAKGRLAVEKIFGNFVAKDIYCKLLKDFDEVRTKEAVFARKCDKLECDLQARMYSDEGNLKMTEKLPFKSDFLDKLKNKGVCDVADYFILYDRQKYFMDTDDIFLKINKFIEGKSILKKAKKEQKDD